MLFMTMASPLTGAPGAVCLYGLIGADRLAERTARGPARRPRARASPGRALWLLMAWLWLEAPSSSPDAITDAINAAPSGMSWLSTVQNWAANGAKGNGVPIALVLGALSLAIGIGGGGQLARRSRC